MILGFQRKHADRQPFGADGDGDFERSVLARQPWQRAGLRKACRRIIAGVTRGAREDHRAESRRWQENHLPIGEMRREQVSDIALREGRGRAQDQLGVADGFGNASRYQRQLHVVSAIGVLEDNARACRAMRRYLGRVAPPQADIVALERKITRGRERAVAAAKHRDLQDASPCAGAGPSSCRSMKCCTLPKAVRGRSSTKMISRGTLKRASCVNTCAFKFSASTKHPERLMT